MQLFKGQCERDQSEVGITRCRSTLRGREGGDEGGNCISELIIVQYRIITRHSNHDLIGEVPWYYCNYYAFSGKGYLVVSQLS